MSSPSAKFVLTGPETWQFRPAQSVDPALAKEVSQLCEGCRDIRACYLLDTRKSEDAESKFTIALSLENEKSQLDKIAAEFQTMLCKFPAMAQNTAIISSRPFEKMFAGAAFYVRPQRGKHSISNWLSRMTNPPLRNRPSEPSIFLPHGRIGRVAYAVRWAATLAAYAALGSVQDATIGSESSVLVKSLSFVLFAFLVITSIKRLHDFGYGAVAVIFLGPIVPLLLLAPGERGSNTYGDPPPKPFSGTAKVLPLATLLFATVTAHAQLTVSVSPVKVSGQKAIVPLEMKNDFVERIESARAVCFILDEQGKMVGQGTQWVIGGDRNKSTMASGATNAFNFVVAFMKPSATTNLTSKVAFSRVVLEGGKLADPAKQVTVTTRNK